MNAEEHPALITDHDGLPTLTLILPRHLGKVQILQGLVQAIGQVRSDLAARACRFQRRVQECAASGDRLGQALCRGQVLGGEHAASAIDEEIIGIFDLWDQYEDDIPQAGHSTGDEVVPRGAHPATGAPHGQPSAGQHPHQAAIPTSPGRQPGHLVSRHSLGLGKLEAAVMAVAWQAPSWLPVRTVHDRLDYPRLLASTTVSSVVSTLHHKGLLTRRRGSAGCWEYRAARSLDEHIGDLIGDLLDATPDAQTALSHALRRPVHATSTE
jgi:predicted transcriptional regulator